MFLSIFFLSCSGDKSAGSGDKIAVKTYPVTAVLPADIKWETNDHEAVYADPRAKTGGVLKTFAPSYPLTFRLFGPNSNDYFANWNRVSCLDFNLVDRHPYTLNPIPGIATHWAVMADQKTIYFKIDPDVKFGDGTPLTADDFLFGYEMMLSDEIKDPFYNKYYKEKLVSVEKIDDHTIKIVGAYPSWRALFDFQVTPVARHATQLTADWVKRANWQRPVCVGPYVIDSFKDGRYVRFARVKGWWGDHKRYYKGRFNFDKIDLKIIRDEQSAFRHFIKGELTFFNVGTAQTWATETNFDAVKKGWVVKRKIYVKKPAGKFGMAMNYKDPLIKNIAFRKALQHLFDFDKINKNIMYNDYTRLNSFFEGTQYANEALPSYPYDPAKADAHLKEAGWLKRGADGILVNDKGERCSFTLTYGSQGLTPHLTVYVEDLKKAGVEMKLRLVDGAKAFKDGLERNFQVMLISMSGEVYPSIEQYLHSDYARTSNNNNFFSFADKEIDSLIAVYNTNLDFNERVKAVHRIDEIVKDEAFYIPFWHAPYLRVLFWNNLRHPDDYEPLYTSSANEYMTYWFDEELDTRLKQAMQEGREIPNVNDKIEVDPHGLLK
ncbi:MAG: ABC transporter substrate-binding protein [Deltaproteobacteria bacterium]|nr:ABC transporter substrate-binding protein [Deltaproteobacteria bacterium]